MIKNLIIIAAVCLAFLGNASPVYADPGVNVNNAMNTGGGIVDAITYTVQGDPLPAAMGALTAGTSGATMAGDSSQLNNLASAAGQVVGGTAQLGIECPAAVAGVAAAGSWTGPLDLIPVALAGVGCGMAAYGVVGGLQQAKSAFTWPTDPTENNPDLRIANYQDCLANMNANGLTAADCDGQWPGAAQLVEAVKAATPDNIGSSDDGAAATPDNIGSNDDGTAALSDGSGDGTTIGSGGALSDADSAALGDGGNQSSQNDQKKCDNGQPAPQNDTSQCQQSQNSSTNGAGIMALTGAQAPTVSPTDMAALGAGNASNGTTIGSSGAGGMSGSDMAALGLQ
jgi:hypothetical protein